MRQGRPSADTVTSAPETSSLALCLARSELLGTPSSTMRLWDFFHGCNSGMKTDVFPGLLLLRFADFFGLWGMGKNRGAHAELVE